MMLSKPLDAKISLAAFASAVFTLGFAHHLFRFWELEVWKQGALLLPIPLLYVALAAFLRRIWKFLPSISPRRWLLILLPALGAASAFAWFSHDVPAVWHTLRISPEAGEGVAVLYEVKYPPGRVYKLSQAKETRGWILESGALRTARADAVPLELTFIAPIGQYVDLLFLSVPNGSSVAVSLDGQTRRISLLGEAGGFRFLRLKTAYKMGIPAAPVLGLIALTDFFACFFFLLLLWLIQEISRFDSSAPPVDGFLSHHTNLAILSVLAFIFHALNFLSVPLIIASDSPGYLRGVIHWMQYHNLDGVPAARGPAMTFIFMPAFLLAGSHPWGVKFTLHLFAIGVVFLSYLLVWRIYRRRSFAFFSGLLALFIPELYLYSNFVMSEVPNVFFVLAYCIALLAALETPTWRNLVVHALLGAFVVLLRPENFLLLALGMGFLLFEICHFAFFEGKPHPGASSAAFMTSAASPFESIRRLLVTFALAAVPLLGWSVHNLRVHGFFGLSNYADEVLYDGWIYFGEASRIPITDKNSEAVKRIQSALSAYDKPLGETLVPTGWEIYPALIAYGYGENEAIRLLGDAARDSLRRNPALALELYGLKLRKSFIPPHSGVMEKTFTLDEHNTALPYWDSSKYFQVETTFFSAFIPIQQMIYRFLPVFDLYFYRPLVFFALAAAAFALYQQRFVPWMPLTIIALSRMFVPITIGIAHWHYMLAGMMLLLTLIFLPIQIVRHALRAARGP